MTPEEKLAAIEELVSPQWRRIPVEELTDVEALVEAFSAGRNWMIDRIREVLDK